MGNTQITNEQNAPVQQSNNSSKKFYNSPLNFVAPHKYNVQNKMRSADRYYRNGSNRCNGIRSS